MSIDWTQVPKRWLVGVSGTIAASSLPGVLIELNSRGIVASVVLSKNAARFVSVDVLRACCRGVHSTVFDTSGTISVPHVDLPAQADVVVIMPASFDVIGRVANGIADDLLTSVVASSPKPVIFAPAMNPVMWGKAAVQRNIAQLLSDGYHIVQPQDGRSIAGERGVGAMGSLIDIAQCAASVTAQTRRRRRRTA